ncbi:Tas retrotransposon peptidase A16 [Ancylostoma caninum]|uniref:Tas retrotransposon peptidase A16 n=1 Tax=Ancylostoma caninum TaxID=29170 RepID=A0A368H4A4_ANCCA|nr:Tas retrotransposon peptidase A16 [Ancylostoma caninum]
MCANLTLVNPEDQSKQVNTVAFFDSGSSHLYITINMAERLDLNHITDDQITLHTFGSAHPKTMPSKVHGVSLLLPDKTLYSLKVQSLPMLTKALMAPCALQFTLSDLSSETSIPTEPVQTGILIGADHFWQLVLSSQFYSTTLPNGYYLLNTRLGKVITGKKISTHAINMAVQEHADHPFNKATLDELVERFWECESLGTPNEANSKDDITCLDFFLESECRYYTRLPFRSEPPEVPENFQHSLSCLRSNWRTLSKHPEHL